MTSSARSACSRFEPYAWFFATYVVRTRNGPTVPVGWSRPGRDAGSVPIKSLENSFYGGILVALGLRQDGSKARAIEVGPERDRLQLWVNAENPVSVPGSENYPSESVLAYRVGTVSGSNEDRWVFVVAKRETCQPSDTFDREAMTSWLRTTRDGVRTQSQGEERRANMEQPEAPGMRRALRDIGKSFFPNDDPQPICTAKRRLQTIAVWPLARAADAGPALLDAAIDLTARDPAPSRGLAATRRQELREKHAIQWWDDWALVVHRENTGVVCTTNVANERIRSTDAQYVLVHAWCTLVQAALVELMETAVELGPPRQDGPKYDREAWERQAAALREDVAAFRNRLWFPELTFNSALRRFHHILVEEFALRGLYADVTDEIEMLDDDAQRRLNNTVNRLSEKGFFVLLAASFLGMNVLIEPLRRGANRLSEAMGKSLGTLCFDLVILGLTCLGAWALVKWWLRRPGVRVGGRLWENLRCKSRWARGDRYRWSRGGNSSPDDVESKR